jgi:predicted glycoside hydrolase/deacetylase ChbG (UPF0249 family)
VAKYLIINADDFGLSASVNRGIIEAHFFGTVSSTTLMCNMPGFREAVSLANAIPTLGVGLHFNLTYGKPVSKKWIVPSLINHKGIFSRNSKKWRPEEIALELEAQFSRLAATGLKPTHLDSHHHIHIDSKLVYQAMKHLAIREHIPMRLNSSEADPQALIRCTDHLILDTYDNEDSVNKLLYYLEHLQDGITELMCHPGYVDDVVRTYSKCTDARELELLVFKDQRIIDKMLELDIHLAHFGFVPDVPTLINNDPDEAWINKRIRMVQPIKKPLIKRNRRRLYQGKTFKHRLKPTAKKTKISVPKSRRQQGICSRR